MVLARSGTITVTPCRASRSVKKPSDIATVVPMKPTVVTPCGAARLGDHVGEVEQRDADRGLDLVGDLVEGRGAQQQEVGAGALDAAGGVGEQLTDLRASAPRPRASVSSAKSTVLSTSRGEESPPSRSCTPRLRSR